MTKTSMLLTAALAAVSIASAAQAQTTGATPATPAVPATPATPDAAATPAMPATPATPATAGTVTTPDSTVAVGQPVKDNTGAEIGRVAELKTDAAGKQLATIAMGAETFAVDTASLAVDDGVATINLTAAQLREMIKKPAAE